VTDRRVDVYAKFLPELIIEKAVAGDELANKASGEQFHCAVMFADISGFTPLAESFAKEGAIGAEKLTKTLNDYFTYLVELVTSHGGDVVKFAGDAVLAIWQDRGDEQDLAFATWRAAQCGLAIQDKLRDYEAGGIALKLRVAISSGSINIAHVGGVYARWEFLLSGKPLEQVGIVSDHIEPGYVGTHAAAWSLLETYTAANPVGNEIAPDIKQLDEIAELPKRRNRKKLVLVNEQQARLRHYLPAAVNHSLDAGLDDFLGELRRLTILFVNLPDIHYSSSVETAQKIMIALQESCYRYEGSINKLSVDDKGVSLLAALGLPPLAHEDDPDRGIKAALAIQKALKKLDIRCSIGVSTGRVYCGVVGSELRREYTIMGDNVNLAARLMQNAKGGILCDAATFNRTSEDVIFSEPKYIKLKGKLNPEEVYEPLSLGEMAVGEKRAFKASTPIIGRVPERKLLANKLDELFNNNTSSITFLEAEQGYGKTRLKEDFIELAAKHECALLTANADAIERSTPYYAIRQFLYDALKLTRSTSVSAARQYVNNLCSDSDLHQLLPLISSIISVEIDETEFTQQLEGEVRALQTARVVVGILKKAYQQQTYLIVVDDVHWLDSASWNLLLAMSKELSPHMMLLVSRPVTEPPSQKSELLELANSETLILEPMAADEIVQLVCLKLGVTSIPQTVKDLIQSRAEGHPYFSEEMGYALRDNNIIEIHDGQCQMSETSSGSFDNVIEVPETIEGIITSRIDRLSSTQATTLKVAGVIGKSFHIDILQAIHPVESTQSSILEQLDEFERLNLISRESDNFYMFTHSITKEVAYSLLLGDQRRKIHGKVASWYEANRQDQGSQLGVMAFHWQMAGDIHKALHFLSLATKEALDESANRDAELMANRALVMVKEHKLPISQFAHFLSYQGKACYGLGRLDEAKSYYVNATKAYGTPFPKTKLGLVFSVIKEIIKQYYYARRGEKISKPSPKRQEVLVASASAHAEVQIIYYWSGDKLNTVYACLRAVNLACASGTLPRALVITNSNLGLVSGVIPLHKVANYYIELASQQSLILNHAPTAGWITIPTGTYYSGLGHWEKSESSFQQGLKIFKSIGDERNWATLSSARNSALIIKGELAQALKSYRTLYNSGIRRDDPQSIGWGLLGQARALVRLNDFDKIQDLLDEAAPLLDRLPYGQRLDHLTISALLNIRSGSIDLALSQLSACMDLLMRPGQITLFCGALQLTILNLAIKNRGDQEKADEYSNKTEKFLKTFAKIFPISKACYHYSKGISFEIEGDREAARESLLGSLALGIEYDLPYETVLSLDALRTVCPQTFKQNEIQYKEASEKIGTTNALNPLEI